MKQAEQKRIPDAVREWAESPEAEKAWKNLAAGCYLAMRQEPNARTEIPEICKKRLERAGIPPYSLDYIAFEWFYNGFNTAVFFGMDEALDDTDEPPANT